MGAAPLVFGGFHLFVVVRDWHVGGRWVVVINGGRWLVVSVGGSSMTRKKTDLGAPAALPLGSE